MSIVSSLFLVQPLAVAEVARCVKGAAGSLHEH